MKCEIARQNCSMPSTLEISFHVPAVIFPAANSNPWRSRVPLRTIHALSSPMNLPGISIPRTRCAFELLQKMVTRGEKALLLVTHNPSIAEASDWIHEMKDGRIVASHARGQRISVLADT